MARLNNFYQCCYQEYLFSLSEAELYFFLSLAQHTLYIKKKKSSLVLTNHLQKEEQFAEY